MLQEAGEISAVGNMGISFSETGKVVSVCSMCRPTREDEVVAWSQSNRVEAS